MDLSQPDLDVLLARAGWPRLLFQLLAGVSHDLNGRVTSVGGVAQLLALEDDSSEARQYLYDEVRPLRTAASLLGVLVDAHRDDRGEGVRLAALMPQLVELQRRHRTLRGVEWRLEVDPAAPAGPGWTALLLPVVLLTLAAGAEAAAERDGVVEVRLRGRGGDMELTSVATGRSKGGCEPPTSVGEGAGALAELADAAGGELAFGTDDEGVRLRLTLPGFAP